MAYSGTAWATVMPAISDRSVIPPRRHVAVTPATKLTTEASRIETPMRSSVHGRCDRMRSVTGVLRAMENPRSPWASRVT